jgi:hypothetical protein
VGATGLSTVRAAESRFITNMLFYVPAHITRELLPNDDGASKNLRRQSRTVVNSLGAWCTGLFSDGRPCDVRDGFNGLPSALDSGGSAIIAGCAPDKRHDLRT